MEERLNILIVYAHFEEKSFNAAMRRTAQATLARLGHDVVVSDLYREGFAPVPDPAAFTERVDESHFELMREQAHANERGSIPAPLAREQARVAGADSILFQFPLWWWSLPAILKGWVDQVFANGFAYGAHNLAGKSAMLCLTAETKAKRFEPDAEFDILRHIERGMLAYCGLEVLPHFVAPEILSASAARRQSLLDGLSARLELLFPATVRSGN